MIDPTKTPGPGDRKWSRFFNSWVELTQYTSDRDYYFKVLDNPQHTAPYYHNQSNWSELLQGPPINL